MAEDRKVSLCTNTLEDVQKEEIFHENYWW